MTDKSVFETLNAINVNGHTEKKNGLTYLSWAFAWAEVKKIYPDATYRILCNESSLPYFYDEGVGFMCVTEVTINGQTLGMWLPVMDGANKAMKKERYTYDTKFKKDIPVEAATMFDINKTIMRCLVKNLAMFGLGLYIYAGEDLPEEEKSDEQKKIEEEMNSQIDEVKAQQCKELIEATESDTKALLVYVSDKYGRKVKSIDELIGKEWRDVMLLLGKKMEAIEKKGNK